MTSAITNCHVRTDEQMPQTIYDPTDRSKIPEVLKNAKSERIVWAGPRGQETEALQNPSDHLDVEVHSFARRYSGMVLPNWEVQAHAYSREQAAEVGLFGRLFSGEVNSVEVGVIHEAKRFNKLAMDDALDIEVGVAVRLVVAASSFDSSLGLTLPNIVAAAQIGGSSARVGLSVVGFTGALGSLLPAPNRLDVETCVDYMVAFSKLQAHVFSGENEEKLLPALLSFETKE